MPMIVKGTPLMKIVSPTGLISWPTFSGAPQSSSRVAVPITHTFRAISSSNSLNIRPYSTTCSFISTAAGHTPRQFHGRNVFPLADKVAGMRISGEKSVTRGAAKPLAFRFERLLQERAHGLGCAAGARAQLAIRFEQTKVIARNAVLHGCQALQFPAGEHGVRGARPGVCGVREPRHLL